MYLPEEFSLTDRQATIAFAEQHAFATIITVDEHGPVANLLPLLAEEENGQLYLRGHMAKANSQWQQFASGQEVLVVFQGPHAYISPNYYANRGVPTWNYSMVQMRGAARVFTGTEELSAVIAALANKYEASQPTPWQPAVPERVLPMLVGFEIAVTDIRAKFKLNQNRAKEDQDQVIRQLEQSPKEEERALATLMRQHLS